MGFGDQGTLGDLQTKLWESGEESEFHPFQVEFCLKGLIGRVDDNRGQFLRRENEMNGNGNDGQYA